MDIAQYSAMKRKGAITLMPVGKKGHFAVGITKFDPTNGLELDPELERIPRETVEAAQKAFEAALASCNEMLKDMDAALAGTASPD